MLVCEGRTPSGWLTTRGVYANLSDWPRSVYYYVKCPKCGLVNGHFSSMADAQAQKLCATCNLDAINDLKDQVEKVVNDPGYKPKEMAKIVAEADSSESDDSLNLEIDRLLLGNWVDQSLYEFYLEQDADPFEFKISEEFGDYNPADKNSTTMFKLRSTHAVEDWLFFKNEDIAEAYAVELVTADLQSDPELFNQNWLQQFIDMDKLRAAVGDPHEDWEYEVRDLNYTDLLDKLVAEDYVQADDPLFFTAAGDPRPENTERREAIDQAMTDYIENEKPTVDPWEFLRDIEGDKALEAAIRMGCLDVDEAAKSAVSIDGWPHFVNRYDGSSETLENNSVYCRA